MNTPERPPRGSTEPHASATRSAVDSGLPRGGLVQQVTERLQEAEKTIAQLRKKLSKERKRRSNFQHKYKTLQNSCNFERKQLGVQRKTESEPSALNLNRIESLSLPKLQQLQQLKESELYSNKIDAKQHGNIRIYNYNNSMKQGDFAMKAGTETGALLQE